MPDMDAGQVPDKCDRKDSVPEDHKLKTHYIIIYSQQTWAYSGGGQRGKPPPDFQKGDTKKENKLGGKGMNKMEIRKKRGQKLLLPPPPLQKKISRFCLPPPIPISEYAPDNKTQ